ncbi:MAG: DUF2163 domain-containing protein [Burkholderiales bacterium]|nr:DUF2163 domain-containing protein [Burkholderiales bacterium]
MKDASPGMIAHLGSEVTTLAVCLRIECVDGLVLAVTDHDLPLTIDGLTYEPALDITAVTSASDMSVGNLDAEGLIDSAGITAQDIETGKYDGAAVEVFEVNWKSPQLGRLQLRRGHIGEAIPEGARWRFEVRDLVQRYTQQIVELTSITCRADLGDARCGAGLEALEVSGIVQTVTSRRTFTDSARTEVDGYFDHGKVTFISGLNTGLSMEVKLYQVGALELHLPMPYAIEPGDLYEVTPGCDKLFATCRDRYGNQNNFRGEPHLPGEHAFEFRVPPPSS